LKEKMNVVDGCESRRITLSTEADKWLKQDELLIAELTVDGITQRNWYKEGLPILEKSGELKWQKTAQGIEIWSEAYIHAVEIDGVENLPDNYFSLLPGERKRIACEECCGVTVSGFTFA